MPPQKNRYFYIFILTVDYIAQQFLSNEQIDNNRVTVYHMFKEPRNHVSKFPTQGGYISDEDRDSSMTNASNYDIAWVRPGKENSGTAINIMRRHNKLLIKAN